MKTIILYLFGFLLLLCIAPLAFCFGVLFGVWRLLHPFFFALSSWLTKPSKHNPPTYSIYSEENLKQIQKNREWYNKQFNK